MRQALVSVQGSPAARFFELEGGRGYRLEYQEGYAGPPASLALPVRSEPYEWAEFPAFFDGLLPEGVMLDALLRTAKLDRDDCFGQLLAVGADTVGAVTVTPETGEDSG